jgi:hypothetical protein
MKLRTAGVIAGCGVLLGIAGWWSVSRGLIAIGPSGLARLEHLEPAERDAAFVRAFDTVLREEGLDAEWSATMSNRVKAHLDAHPSMDTSLKVIECKSTLCRIGVSHKTGEAQRSFTLGVSEMIPRRSNAFISPEGGTASVVYFARENHNLPVDRASP